MVSIKTLKVGDYLLQSGGGIRYAKFMIVAEIKKDRIIFKDIYERKEVSLYPGNEDVFTFNSSDTYHTQYNEGGDILERFYKIPKRSYTAIANAYKKYQKAFSQIKEIYRDIYWEHRHQ